MDTLFLPIPPTHYTHLYQGIKDESKKEENEVHLLPNTKESPLPKSCEKVLGIEELFFAIINQTEPADWARLSKVSKFMRNRFTPHFWKNVFNTRIQYTTVPLVLDQKVNFREHFKQNYSERKNSVTLIPNNPAYQLKGGCISVLKPSLTKTYPLPMELFKLKGIEKIDCQRSGVDENYFFASLQHEIKVFYWRERDGQITNLQQFSLSLEGDKTITSFSCSVKTFLLPTIVVGFKNGTGTIYQSSLDRSLSFEEKASFATSDQHAITALAIHPAIERKQTSYILMVGQSNGSVEGFEFVNETDMRQASVKGTSSPTIVTKVFEKKPKKSERGAISQILILEKPWMTTSRPTISFLVHSPFQRNGFIDRYELQYQSKPIIKEKTSLQLPTNVSVITLGGNGEFLFAGSSAGIVFVFQKIGEDFKRVEHNKKFNWPCGKITDLKYYPLSPSSSEVLVRNANSGVFHLHITKGSNRKTTIEPMHPTSPNL